MENAPQAPPDGASVFGQLVDVASLRDSACGRYREPLAERVFGEHPVHRRLWRLHIRLFREWLALTLEQQVADLDQYFPAQTAIRKDSLKEWARFSRYDELIPAGAALPERLLFVCDLDVDLEVLRANLEPAPFRRTVDARRTQLLYAAWRVQLSQ